MTSKERPHRAYQWENQAVFRETFLTLCLEPALAELLRQVGRTIYFESRRPELPPDNSGDLAADLLGAAQGLRQIEGFLRNLGQGRDLSVPGKYRAGLAQIAAKNIASLAAAFEETLR